MKSNKIIIGITGGIASGKSLVSSIIKELGYDLVDADIISREITSRSSKVLVMLQKEFGDDILSPQGMLDRKRLATIVFDSDEKRKALEGIVTEEIKREAEKRLTLLKRRTTKKLIFLDAPTLFESGSEFLVDYVWMVTAPLKTRLNRAVLRDGSTEYDVISRMKAQLGDDEKIRMSEEIINNSGTKEMLKDKVVSLIAKYEEKC